MNGFSTQSGSPFALAQPSFYQRVSQGDIRTTSPIIVRGHNPSQTSASGMLDLSEFGDITYLTAAETMDIVSTDAADTAAGTGMRTLLVQGVDNTGAAIEEIITLAGVVPVTTVNEYLRVNSMVGLTVGSGGFNAGTITATASTAVTIQDRIGIDDCLSACSFFTVPTGNTLFVLQAEFNVSRLSGGTAPVVEFEARARLGGDGNAWLLLFDRRKDAAVSDETTVIPAFPARLIARTDVRFRSDTDQNSTETRSRLYGLLVADTA